MVRVWSGAEKCRTDAERQLAQSQHARAHRERPPGHPRKSRTAPLPPNPSHKLRLTSTLLLSVISELAAPPSPYANLKYDPVKDFTPTGLRRALVIAVLVRRSMIWWRAKSTSLASVGLPLFPKSKRERSRPWPLQRPSDRTLPRTCQRRRRPVYPSSKFRHGMRSLPLVLLCHKLRRERSFVFAPQHGQRERMATSFAMSRRRKVEIELGTWRSGRNGGASRSVTFGKGKLWEENFGNRF
jgi:hypothetical protein